MIKGQVSVIMPCYNDGRYIEESIRSVNAQTYKPIELIVIDDGSDDMHTIRVLKNLNEGGICRVLRTEHVGVAQARNHGIVNAEGEYILPLDADDLIDSSYIEKAVHILQDRSEVGVVYCQADKFGKERGVWKLPPYSFEQMLKGNIVFITALFYKADWEAVGGFNSNMTVGLEDYDFWISILDMGREIYQIPETLFHYRIKGKSRSTELKDDVEHLRMMYAQIYENHREFYQRHHEEYVKALRNELVDMVFFTERINRVFEKIGRIPFAKAILKWIAG